MDNPLQRYKSQKFLIVEDFSEFRQSLKKMAESFGAQHVDLCKDAEEAIELYAEQHHTIILSDYNLGEGNTGLQLLEELHYRHLMRPETIFVLITAETAMDLVMGALEYRPNDYLAKPFTRTTLKSRLDRLVVQKLTMQVVYKAINQDKPKRAIALCDKILEKEPRLAGSALKLKGELLLQQALYSDAENVFRQVLDIREQNWALLGLAKACLAMEKIAAAKEACERIINKNKFALEAYDLISECLVYQREYEQAYSYLKRAVDLSPNSLVRQRNLGKLALRYHEHEVALPAFKQVIKLGQHSVKLQPEDFVFYLQTMTHVQIHACNNQSRRISKEYPKVFRELERRFPDDIQLRLAEFLHKALFHLLAGKKDEAEKVWHEQLEKIAILPDKLKPFLIDEIQFVCGFIESAELQTRFQNILNKNVPELETTQNPEKAQSFNRQGMAKFKIKEFGEAAQSFKVALMNAPDNVNIALNLLQCIYKQKQKQPDYDVDTAVLNLCDQSLKALDPKDHRFNHSRSLFKGINKLNEKVKS